LQRLLSETGIRPPPIACVEIIEFLDCTCQESAPQRTVRDEVMPSSRQVVNTPLLSTSRDQLIIEIDRFNGQPLKARVARTANIRGRTIDATDSVGTDTKAKLGSDDDAISRNLAQETSKQFLVLVWTVGFGRIEEVAAEL